MGLTRVVTIIVFTLFAVPLAAPVMVLGIPFWFVSFLTRAIACLIRPKSVPWREIIEFEQTIGWRTKANLNTYYLARGNDICHVKTDSQGWPGETGLTESEVVVFGDSFAFGYGVDMRSSFAEVNPQLRVKGIGTPGYNMVQELLLMRQWSPQLRDKLVVWFICLENDLYDNLNPDKPNFYKTPFLRSLNGGGEWEVVTSHVAPTRWHCPDVESPYDFMLAKFCTSGFASQRAFSACGFLIREGSDVCRRAGAKLIVLTIPNKNQLSQPGLEFLASHLVDVNGFDPDLPDQEIEKICRDCGVTFVAGKAYLGADDYKENDTHWNERGNRRVAELLGRLYQDYLPEKAGRKTVEGRRGISKEDSRPQPSVTPSLTQRVRQ